MTDKTSTIQNESPIQPGRYRHFKGKEYEVIGEVIHSETEELLVLYRPLYGEGKLWVRPKAMFLELVDRDGRQIQRFSYLGPHISE